MATKWKWRSWGKVDPKYRGVQSKVHADGREVFYARVWVPDPKTGKRRSRLEQAGTDLEEARKLREQRQKDVKRGLYTPKKTPRERARDLGPTLREFVINDFLKRYQSKGGSDYYRNTFVGAGKKIREHPILTDLGDKRIREITRADLDGFKVWRLKAVAPSTVRKNLMTLNKVLRKAVDWGVLDSNPAAGMEKPPEPKGKRRFFDWDEWQRIEAVASDYQGGWLKPILTVAVFTGLRRKELLGLTWDDVNWTDGVHGALELSDDNKIGESRTVRISKQVRHVLEKDLGGRFLPKDRNIFLSPDGEPMTTKRAGERVSDRTKSILKLATVQGASFHTTRHTVGSWMAQAGVPMYEVGYMLGHKTVQTTMGYAHLAPGHQQRAVAALDAMGSEGSAASSAGGSK